MDMRCAQCGRYGVYWKGLGTNSPITYCPYCQRYNCHIQVEEMEDEEDALDNEG